MKQVHSTVKLFRYSSAPFWARINQMKTSKHTVKRKKSQFSATTLIHTQKFIRHFKFVKCDFFLTEYLLFYVWIDIRIHTWDACIHVCMLVCDIVANILTIIGLKISNSHVDWQYRNKKKNSNKCLLRRNLDCSPNPCRHNGQCQNTTTGHLCTCHHGLFGQHCEKGKLHFRLLMLVLFDHATVTFYSEGTVWSVWYFCKLYGNDWC